jgi:hypothetical protein
MSLPLPDTPEKSLLVIPCDFSLGGNTVGSRLTGITLTLVPTGNAASGKAMTLSVPLGKPYAVFAVDPGSYVFSSVTIYHAWFDNGRQWNAWKDTFTLGGGIFVQPQTVLLNYSLLKYADRPDPNSGYDFSFWLSGLDRGARVLAQMKKDTHWSAWEGYDLVNFPRE